MVLVEAKVVDSTHLELSTPIPSEQQSRNQTSTTKDTNHTKRRFKPRGHGDHGDSTLSKHPRINNLYNCSRRVLPYEA
jgi:hypothetical protein